MDAILLAAGYGKRLGNITKKTPKCLVKINKRILLDIWINFLIKNKFKNIIINTHWLSDKVKKFISKNKYKKYIKISHEQKLLGTAGTIKKNIKYLKNKNNIFVAHADNLAFFNFKNFLNCHLNKPNSCSMTMLAFKTTDPKNCGILKIDKNKILNEFYEKKKEYNGNLANGAIYLLDRQIIEFISKNINKKENDFSLNVIPKLKGKIKVYKSSGYFKDIGTKKNLNDAKKYIEKLKRIKNF
tara:strand:- start:2511 stop:3236 length:726 start_codon:yes stop_codon:yes gene_type:complete